MNRATAAQARGSAPARTALAGNPSDGFGGAVLATTFDDFRAEVLARRAEQLTIDPASDLVRASVLRFARELLGDRPAGALTWSTSIPLEVGFASSSALVIATLRTLCALHEIELEPLAVADLALAVEREDLGIAGGRQDQVVQAHGGLMLMDFAADRHERVHGDGLPPLLIAYLPSAAEDSGVAHAPLRERAARGEPEVLTAVDELAELAREAGQALLAADNERFSRCVDATFDVRARVMRLDARHVAMIECARSRGAGANYCGSGGAVVCVCRDESHRGEVAQALRRLGCETLVPSLPTLATQDAKPIA